MLCATLPEHEALRRGAGQQRNAHTSTPIESQSPQHGDRTPSPIRPPPNDTTCRSAVEQRRDSCGARTDKRAGPTRARARTTRSVRWSWRRRLRFGRTVEERCGRQNRSRMRSARASPLTSWWHAGPQRRKLRPPSARASGSRADSWCGPRANAIAASPEYWRSQLRDRVGGVGDCGLDEVSATSRS